MVSFSSEVLASCLVFVMMDNVMGDGTEIISKFCEAKLKKSENANGTFTVFYRYGINCYRCF